MKTLEKTIKSVIVVGLLFTAFLGPSQKTYAFPVNGIVQVTPNQVVVQFCNNTWNWVLTCSAQATGYLNAGPPLSVWGTLYLPPQQCGYAYVYANYPYYFVGGNGFADCR